MEKAFQRGVSVCLIARPNAKGELKPAVLGLAAEPGEFGFLQVYPHIQGVQRHPRGFAVREMVQ